MPIRSDDAQTSTSFGLVAGRTASEGLVRFLQVFEPLTPTTDGAKTLRIDAFRVADPNGNGLCSLAELEASTLKLLMAAYPRKGEEEEGKDLWDAFRPSFVRAFKVTLVPTRVIRVII